MSGFFFHTDADMTQSDTVGEDLVSIDEAKLRAVAILSEMLKGNGERFWASEPWTLTVADRSGLTLFQIEVFGRKAPSLGS